MLRLLGGLNIEAAAEEKCSEGTPGVAFTHLHVPFGAVALQQLANAIMASKKVTTSLPLLLLLLLPFEGSSQT